MGVGMTLGKRQHEVRTAYIVVGLSHTSLFVLLTMIYVMCYKCCIPMIRTQVYLTEEQARDIKLQALREKKREAEVIRELLDKGLRVTHAATGETTGHALMKLVDLGKRLGMTGPRDLSTNLDDYLYGDKE